MKNKITKKDVLNEYKEELNKLTKPEPKLKDIEKFKSKYLNAISNVEPKPRVALGNFKLPETTAITNCGSWFNCDGRKNKYCDICEICYDKFREVMSQKVCQSRLNHEVWFRTMNNPKLIAFGIIGNIIRQKKQQKKKRKKINLHRWNEVGEIRNQDELEKINKISNYLFEIYGIESYIYTHNKNLNFDIDRPHLTINGSNFMVDNEFRCMKEDEYNKYIQEHECYECIGNCEECNTICSKKLNITIVEKIRM